MRVIHLTASLSLVWLAVAGCTPRVPGNTGHHIKLGSFSADVAEVQLLSDGRRAKVLKTLEYTDANNQKWIAPVGTIIDGASIPQAFWTIIGGPYEGKYRFASIIHDRYCDDHANRRWEDVHYMFYEACLAGGTDPALAKVMYGAVYHFGPRWKEQKKGAEELRMLIAPERARLAGELETLEMPSRDIIDKNPNGNAPTQAQYRDLVLAPRAAPRDIQDPATAATLAKWDRIRDAIRSDPNITPADIQKIR